MHRLTVLYGHPEDPSHFDQHYRDVHAPLAAKIPGLAGYTWGHCQAPEDGRPAYHLMALLLADSSESMQAALGSDEGKAAVADLDNFATGGVTMFFDDVQVEIEPRFS